MVTHAPRGALPARHLELPHSFPPSPYDASHGAALRVLGRRRKVGMSACAISALFTVGRQDSKLWRRIRVFPRLEESPGGKGPRAEHRRPNAPVTPQAQDARVQQRPMKSLGWRKSPHPKGDQMVSHFSSAKLNSTSSSSFRVLRKNDFNVEFYHQPNY